MVTEDYIKKHQNTVKKWLSHFSSILQSRVLIHDRSKLKEPELSLWKKMDEEPMYPYGSKEYSDKLKRHHHVFELHWKNPDNRHHPEHFTDPTAEMDLIDMVEMLCDWLGYKETLSYAEASKLVEQQCKRFNFPEEFRSLLLNTLSNYFVTFGESNIADEQHKKADKIIKSTKSGSMIDIFV